MIQYDFLNKLLQQVEPSSITVDIFDTVLLRKWQPEAWRFYSLAKPMSRLVSPDMADTTTTIWCPSDLYRATRLATARILSGVPTDVPPYFCTIKLIDI